MATRRGRTQAYAAGNKVYGAGRPMPTIGPVDKTGYRERDAKGMIWKNALSRRLGMGGQQPGGMKNYQVPLPQRTMPQAGAEIGNYQVPMSQPQENGISNSMKLPVNTRTATGRPSPTIGGGLAGGAPGGGGPASQTVKQIAVKPLMSSPSGQLQAQANQGMNGLPYDPSYEGTRRAIEAKRAAANAGLAQQRAQMDIEANTQKREIDQQAPTILRQLLEAFAGRGLAYSGRYAADVGEQQNEFASAKSQIDRALAGNRSALEAEMAKFEAGLQSELSEAEYRYAREMAERAGNLGIVDQPAPEPEVWNEPLFEPEGNPGAIPTIAPSVARPEQRPTYDYSAEAQAAAPNNLSQANPQVVATLNSGALTAPRAENPNQQYQSPAPPRAQSVDLASQPGGTRSMSSFKNEADRAKLANGGTVTAGNGYVYKYDPNTGQTVRVR